MKAVWMLVVAETRRHWFRVLLTSLATAAAVCLVIWVIGGYDVLTGRSGTLAERLLEPYDAILQTQRAANEYATDAVLAETIDPQFVDRLRSDSDVAVLEPVMAVRTRMLYPVGPGGPGPMNGRKSGGPKDGSQPDRSKPKPQSDGPKGKRAPNGSKQQFRPMGPGGSLLTGTDAEESPYRILEGRWLDLDHPERMEAVLSASTAGSGGPFRMNRLKPGAIFKIRGLGGELFLTVAGIVDQPRTVRSFGGLYTTMAVARKISGQTPRINRLHIGLKEGTVVSDFRSRWQQQLEQTDPPLQLTTVADVTAEINEGRQMAILEQQRFYATGIAILGATFIIFTTLSMGVSERIRHFAMLRAVGMTRRQIACVVLCEGTLLAMFGWLAGLAAGWGLLILDSEIAEGLSARSIPLSTRSILISIACVLVGAGAAALLPAWSATRLKPLDVMSSAIRPRRVVWPVVGVIAGLVLLCVNPLLVYGVSVSSHFRYASYLLIGCTSMALGFVLVAPLVVVVVERVLGPVLAPVLRLSRHLIAQQLSSNLWRSVGTVVCLTVGLGLFVSVQIWGHSMVVPFLPGEHLPDVVVSFMPSGLPESEVDAVRKVDGIIAEQCVPVAVEQAKITKELLQSEGLTRPRQKAVYLFMAEQDNVMLLGVDPQQAIGGDDPTIGMKFVQGDRDTAIRKLNEGRYCLVPDHFHVETGLGIGDRLGIIPPNAPDTTLTWEISGVVSIPGWQWVTKMSDMRRNAPKTLAAVFISYDNARRDFDLDRINFFWANTKDGTSARELQQALEPIAERNGDVTFRLSGVGEVKTAKPYVSVTDVREVERIVRWRTESVLWMMSKFPLIVLAIMTLAVVNTIMASVRARRWELGVLRAVGLTRGGLARLVLAEAILVGVVACALSLAFGLTSAWCANGICTYIFYFGGLQPPLVVPWTKLLLGFSGTLALCLIAALVPAIATGKTEPAKLLQSGRAAM